MIRDLLILHSSGIPIFSQNFGECHSFDRNVDEFSAFISAIRMFSEQMLGEEIKLIVMEEKKFAFHREGLYTYALITDVGDPKSEILTKIRKVAEIFSATYGEKLQKFTGNTSDFENFGNILIELKVAQKNCGGRPECEGCPNSTKSLPLSALTESLQKKTTLGKLVKDKRLHNKLKGSVKETTS